MVTPMIHADDGEWKSGWEEEQRKNGRAKRDISEKPDQD